jgi:glycosyltransferase involved in cell wall biosynthesis
MKVLLYGRKCRPNANYSLENVFSDIAQRLRHQCEIQQRIAPCFSNGILPRLRIIRDVKQNQLPVTHVTGDISFAILGADRKSSMVTIPDCGFVKHSTGIARFLKKMFWLQRPVRHARVVTTISEAAKREIVEMCPWARDKVHVVPIAISQDFQPKGERVFSKVPRILHVGTAPNKNVLRLIQSLEGIRCELTIIGVLPNVELEALQRHGIDFRNRFGLSSREVVEEYQRADLVAFVSTYEGFGMPILEAQAVGVPVVTSNQSSMPEVAGDGAVLVDPWDVGSIREGIQRVINDQDLRNETIAHGFRNVLRYDPQEIAGMYLKLYYEIWNDFSNAI